LNIRNQTFLSLKRSCYCGLMFQFLFGSILYGHSMPNTNLEQMVQVIDSLWIDCLSKLNIEQDESIVILGFNSENPVHALIQRRLENQLFQKRIRVHTDSDSTLPDRQFVVDILTAGLFYSPGGRQKLFGKRWIRRHVTCHISVQLLSGTEKLILCKSFERECTDRIFIRHLPYIEQQGAVLGYPDRPDDSDLISRLEPWFMVGSVTVIVYLFYIIRS